MTIAPLRDPGINKMLEDSWKYYKEHFIEKDTNRPLADPDEGDLDGDGTTTKERVTYSETIAYVLLRSVWMNDRDTFAKVWTWAKTNMQRTEVKETYSCKNYICEPGNWEKQAKAKDAEFNNHLFAWRWVPSLNGGNSEGGIIKFEDIKGVDRSGINGASDDLEIAAALYFASALNWGAQYLSDARDILKDAWNKYVFQVGTRHYLFAGDQFIDSGVINPSYFRPAYYSRVFPAIDPEHPWEEVAETSYAIILDSGNIKLDGMSGKESDPQANLPSNWITMNPYGNYGASYLFPKTVGEIFGRDAFRTLWAVAQDAAWFNNNSALSYLQDCAVGPLCFLEKNLKPENYKPTAFHHNGKPILQAKPDAKFPQTWGLNKEQLSFYGAYLPFFHYAGNENMEKKILARLEEDYYPAGHWGKNGGHYYTQSWIPLGLLLTNDYTYKKPNGDEFKGLFPIINAIPLPKIKITRQEELAKLPRSYFTQVDPKLGGRDEGDFCAKFNRELLVENTTIDQLGTALSALTDAPYEPLKKIFNDLAQKYPQLQELEELDAQNATKLRAYFADFREYWNNTITLLSVYAQKVTEANQQGSIHEAISFCEDIRLRIQGQKEYLPHSYSQVVLDITEAELRAQATNKSLDFYMNGIKLASSAINKLFNVDPDEAAPDYYVVAKALIVIGDLYLRLHESDPNMVPLVLNSYPDPSVNYLEKASAFYAYAADMMKGVEIRAEAEEIDIQASPSIIEEALLFNQQKGHIPKGADAVNEAKGAVEYLSGVALAKNASLLIRRDREKPLGEVLLEIENCERAIELLENNNRGGNDFFVSFAKATKADLLLYYADRIKFYFWPKIGSDPVKLGIDRINAINKRVVAEVRQIYSEIPAEFDFLYALAQIKLAEIAVRSAEFIGREFRHLLPFYTHPVFTTKKVIPEDEFLGIELNYLKALLLASSKRKESMEKALELFKKVMADSKKLQDPYPAYFEVYSKLKIAEIHARNKQYDDAIPLFIELEKKAKAFRGEELKQMAWNPASFLAELYHEWADTKLDGTGKYAAEALKMCYESDSEYDFKTRGESVVRKFKLVDLDMELSQRYNRKR